MNRFCKFISVVLVTSIITSSPIFAGGGFGGGGGGGSASVSDAVYGSGWNGDTTTAPSKNAVYDKLETIIAGGLDFALDSSSSGNIRYVGCSDNVADAITAASAGDTLVFGACTYTIASALVVNKSLRFIGQGIGITIFNNTTTNGNTFTVTADGFYLSDIEFTGSDVLDHVNVDCTAGVSCQNIVFERFKMTATFSGSGDAIEVFDGGVTINDGLIIATSTLTGTDQVRPVFIHVAATHDADTTIRVRNLRIQHTCSSDNISAECRGFMIWNNGADQSSFSQTAYVQNLVSVMIPANTTTQTEALENQGAGITAYYYGGSFDAGSLGTRGTQTDDTRIDDTATAYFYDSNFVTGSTDNTNGTVYKRGIAVVGGITGDAAPKSPTSTTTAIPGTGGISLTGGEGGDSSGTGSRTGAVGASFTLISGKGGVANSANTASTGGAAGTFTFTGGVGGAASVGTGTNLGGAGGDFVFTGGTGGAAASGTSNTGGRGGNLTFLGGVGGAGSTAAGAAGTITFGASGLESETWDYSTSNTLINTSSTGVTVHNYRSNGNSRIYLSSDYDANSGTEAPELRLLNDTEATMGFIALEGTTAATKSTGTLANATLVGTEDNYSLQFITNDSVRMTVLNNGLIGIGTTAPTNTLSFSGQAARKIWMERMTTAATAGQNITLEAGGAVSGGTDLNGGSLNLSGGIAVGNNGSTVNIQAVKSGQGTGTTDRTATTVIAVAPTSKSAGVTVTATSDIGWSIQSAENQACNTTCTSAAVCGFDATAGLVGPDDASADQCLCAGAS